MLALSSGSGIRNNEKKPQASSHKPQAPATYCRASYRFLTRIAIILPQLSYIIYDNKRIEMEKEMNGHLYITNDNLKRIADAIEEILRLVKKDMEPSVKKRSK